MYNYVTSTLNYFIKYMMQNMELIMFLGIRSFQPDTEEDVRRATPVFHADSHYQITNPTNQSKHLPSVEVLSETSNYVMYLWCNILICISFSEMGFRFVVLCIFSAELIVLSSGSVPKGYYGQ